ncbi:MAG TPA: glycosyltransferase family 4 protein [Nocardioidaceae bacterium]|nr:glycosyltransferase family 4 protein [Nocardioidaceae bacterium]
MSPSETPARRIGYVLKMYPRFSETFIVNEILALEAAGERLDIFSLRLPVDGRFHEQLADVRAPVTYLPHQLKPAELWEVLQRGLHALPRLSVDLPDVLALGVNDAACAVQLAMLVRDLGITHLHAHFASVATDVARVAARLAGVGYSFTAHAKDIYHESVEPARMRRKLADASAVVTVSDYNRRHLQRTYGHAADHVVRIYNGINLEQFSFDPPRDRPPVVAAVGRLVEKKGFTHLVDAVAEMVRADREVRLHIVGAGDQQPALRAQVDALGLGDEVRFLGALPQAQAREVVRGAAVLAAPCVVGADGNRDGLPTVLLEAMALGTPCVATPVTGVPEAIRHGETGVIVPEADGHALAGALSTLLDDGALRRRLAANARALVEWEFDIRRNSARLREILTPPTPVAAGVG